MRNGNLFWSVVIGSVFLVAACGGGAGNSGPGAPAASSNAPSPATSGSSAVAASTTAIVSGPMPPIASTTLTADLQAIGLDPKKLPTLAKLEPEQLRKVMRTFTKSLGMKCSDCHDESDYAAPTPMKKIASHMWDDYVRALAMNAADPLYCDSCHQGRPKFLDRHDKEALRLWMKASFVDALTRRDQSPNGCATCHGDPFRAQILAHWSK